MQLESPFKHLLNANHIVCDEEGSRLRRYIAELETTLSRLHREIDVMPIGLQWWLCDRRDEVKNTLKAHKVLLSPIRRVPAEILGDIFLQTVPARFVVPKLDKFPLVLTRVSRFWRHTTLNTHRLWASCHLDMTRMSWTAGTSLAEIWLQRSGICPLSLSIQIGPDVPPNENFISVLTTHAFHWRNLHLDLPSEWLPLLFNNLAFNLPLLEDLTLKSYRSDRHRPFLLSSIANNLLRLTLMDVDASIVDSFRSQNLTRLTYYEALRLHQCLHALEHCPKLTRLSIRVIPDRRHVRIWMLPLPVVLLPSLQSLLLAGDKALADTLNHFTLPSLCDISIVAVGLGSFDRLPDDTWPKSELIALVDRSSCPIESLYFSGKNIREDHLVDLVRHMPLSMRRLEVQFGGKSLVTESVRQELQQYSSNSEASPGRQTSELSLTICP
jgi:hypothetical protein